MTKTLTATEDLNLDRFHADMVNAGMEDMLDDLHAADSDYTPVPREYWGMSFSEVCDDIADYALETVLDMFARQQIPYRWQ